MNAQKQLNTYLSEQVAKGNKLKNILVHDSKAKKLLVKVRKELEHENIANKAIDEIFEDMTETGQAEIWGETQHKEDIKSETRYFNLEVEIPDMVFYFERPDCNSTFITDFYTDKDLIEQGSFVDGFGDDEAEAPAYRADNLNKKNSRNYWL